MMLKKTARCLLCLLSALTLFSACGKTEEVPAASTASETVTESTTQEAPTEYFTLSPQTYVMRPTGDVSDDMLTAIKFLTSAGKALVEGGVTVSEDWYRDELVRHEQEILLGVTNRPESGEA